MKEIVVISGKGGTGKTSVTASFAVLGGSGLTVADCDVDAADLHLLLQPDFASREDFFSGEVARIDQEACTGCGRCAAVCRFGAVSVAGGQYAVQPFSCEGCGYCARVCPVGAITNSVNKVGQWYVSTIRTGARMVHATLGIGSENSGKLVTRVKDQAREIAVAEGTFRILIDGSPGIGCPVVSSLSGAAYVVLVTEPTASGVHDLKRVFELVSRFTIPAGCIINKADINRDVRGDIREFLERQRIELLAEIPYDENFTKAMTAGKTMVELDATIGRILEDAWNQITNIT